MRFFVWAGVLLGLVGLSWFLINRHEDPRDQLVIGPTQMVTLSLNRQFLGTFLTETKTVSEFLRSQNIIFGERDRVWPTAETTIVSGMTITLDQARPVTIEADGKRETIQTTADTALAILEEQNIVLDEDDLLEPTREVVVERGGEIEVTRVEIREEHKDTSINFTTKTNEDPELSWRTKKVTVKGEKGVKRTTYRVSYHDGKEVKRKVLTTEIIKEPVTEVVTQGTYVKLGKKHTGAASWYAWTGTFAAANPWLPKGSYVKVTNLDNGKSVIVVINDRGPFVPGRIIDLDKVAFAQIASIGAGVINVKMEEIVN